MLTLIALIACSDKDTDTLDTSAIVDTGTSDATEDTGATDSAEPNDTSDTTDTTDTETDDTDTGADTSDTDTEPTDTSTDTNDTSDTDLACTEYNSPEEEFAPIQITALGTPAGASSLSWTIPSAYTYLVSFAGTAGSPASHEGLDYVHGDANVGVVPVYAAGAGTVVYVRTGCPQSSEFALNNDLRECGSGWGNHVVIDHGNQIYTRYAHLKPNTVSVSVGTAVSEGQYIADMGNSGRSDLRHLHFELGSKTNPFDPCALSQSFDLVYNPEGLF